VGRRDLTIYALLGVLGLGGTAFLAGLTAPAADAAKIYLVWGGLSAVMVSIFGLGWLFFIVPAKQPPLTVSVLMPSTEPPQRDFLDPGVTIEDLIAKTTGRTNIQIDALSATYAGKWLRAIGVVQNVTNVNGDLWMLYMESLAGSYFSATFEKSWHTRLTALNKGDRLTLVGQIDGFRYGVGLKSAEIEHIDGPEAPKTFPRRRASRKGA
jgi:hypothetical protein